MAKRKAKRPGILCPECGAAVRLTYRTEKQDGFTRREKICPAGHRFWTDEAPVDFTHPRGADRVALADDLVEIIQRHGLAELIRRHI